MRKRLSRQIVITVSPRTQRALGLAGGVVWWLLLIALLAVLVMTVQWE